MERKIKGVLIDYRCEICKDRKTDLEDAKRCFARGIGKSVIPRGSIVSLNGYKNMVFVVAGFVIGANEHRGSYRLWGFRDTDAGDNTGKNDYCGDELMHVAYVLTGDADPRYYPLPESNQWLRDIAYDNYKANTKIPAFKRAVKFCKAMDIEAQYWNGKKFVKVAK